MIFQILETLPINIEEVLSDLREHWIDNKDYSYNSTAFTKVDTKGDNAMFCCPHHPENNPSCGIKTTYPYTWNCFGCGATGNLGQLVAHALDLPTEVHGEHYITKNYVILDIKERPKIDLDEIFSSKHKVNNEVSEDYIKELCSKRHSYITDRGFSNKALRNYEVGYDAVTDTITFVVRDSTGLPRFIKRRFVSTKKFLNELGIAKKDIIYGLYYITRAGIKPTEIYLNESETDTISCYQGGLLAGAILGRILFKEQLKELMRYGVKVINLFYDNDKSGVACALISALMINKNTPIRVNMVMYPCNNYGIDTTDSEDISYKDANDLLKSNRLKDITKIPFDTYLMKLKESKLLNIEELIKPKNEKTKTIGGIENGKS